MAVQTEPSQVRLRFGGIYLDGYLDHDDDRRHLALMTDEGPEYISTDLSMYGLTAEAGRVYIKNWTEHCGLAVSLAEQELVTIVDRVYVGPFNGEALLVEVTIPTTT